MEIMLYKDKSHWKVWMVMKSQDDEDGVYLMNEMSKPSHMNKTCVSMVNFLGKVL